MKMKIYAVIPAGGKGLRINSDLPKQFIPINNKEIIVYTLEIFQKCNLIDEIIIPAQKEYLDFLKQLKEKYSLTKITKLVVGGSERQYSVFNAVKAINANDDDLILVHDAVRPLLPLNILEKTIIKAKEFGCAIAAIKAKDTLVKGNDIIYDYIDRNEIYYVQTPQVFKYKIYIEAMKYAEEKNFLGTDESMIAKKAGYEIKIVEGSSLNFKITTEDDLTLFRLIASRTTNKN